MSLKKPRRQEEKPRIVLGVTSFQSLTLLEGFDEYLASLGWDVHLVSSPPYNKSSDREKDVAWHEIDMARQPSVMRDFKALVRWIRLFLRLKPDVVSTGTPKAGLLGMIAAFVTRVPMRTYLLRGLRMETESGLRFKALRFLEKLACAAATDVLAISPSLRDEAVRIGIVSPTKITTLGSGSSNGVDLKTFNPTSKNSELVRNLYERLDLVHGIPVVGFVGRVMRDKGIFELAAASRLLHDRGVSHQLLVVGATELEETTSPWKKNGLTGARSPVLVDRVENIADYYSLMDIFALPTYREGMGNVLLEAGASGLPTVSTRATGARDATVDGQTGFQVAVGDHVELAYAIEKLIVNPQLRLAMGEAGVRFVKENFSRRDVWRRTAQHYGDSKRSSC